MEFRTQAILVVLTVAVGMAQTYEVRHDHLYKSGRGKLTFSAAGLAYEEGDHSRTWKYEDIQRLELGPERIRVLSYDRQRWQLGRDREHVFTDLPKDLATDVYPQLSSSLDRRFVAKLAEPGVKPLWESPARRTGNGTLVIGENKIVFYAGKDSQTWRYWDIQNVSSSGAFDLTLTTIDGEQRFQLKKVLPEEQYDQLWRRFNSTHSTLKEISND